MTKMSGTFKIESNDLTISTIYKDFYTVPDFQREYVWEHEHVEKLLQDVQDEFYDEERRIQEGPEYFLGSIVVCKNEEDIFQLIDGQQRMTTIYLVLCAARDVLVEVKSNAPEWLGKQISDVYADPRTGGDIKQLRLTLQYEDSDGILNHVAKGKPIDGSSEKTESVRRIREAYDTIKEWYRTERQGNPDKIKEFLVAFTNRIKLIRIVTPSLANALKVFETINDRGVGLNAMDLLKNRLFRRISNEDYPILKERWKTLVDTLNGCGGKPLRFLRYYIMSHHQIDIHRGIREDEIYEWFIDHTEECGINTDPSRFADTLIKCARAYANFLNNKNIKGEENRYLQNINLLGGSSLRQHCILLLAARNLERRLFDKLWIENLLFCYLIAEESSKYYERKFAQWSENLRVVNNEVNLNEFMRNQFYHDMRRLRNKFNFNFKELGEDRIRKFRIRYILAKLSQSVEETAWGNPTYTRLNHYTVKEVELEHILPQSPPDDSAFDRPEHYGLYVKKLGNLTLLEKTINSSISNSSYSEKCQGYRQSSFLLTRSC